MLAKRKNPALAQKIAQMALPLGKYLPSFLLPNPS